VHRNAVRLLRLVNTLLDFSRIEAGRRRHRSSGPTSPRCPAISPRTGRAIQDPGRGRQR
jgi:signal transduction histidine kinase